MKYDSNMSKKTTTKNKYTVQKCRHNTIQGSSNVMDDIIRWYDELCLLQRIQNKKIIDKTNAKKKIKSRIPFHQNIKDKYISEVKVMFVELK